MILYQILYYLISMFRIKDYNIILSCSSKIIWNTKVLCISRDLPFSQKEFCAAEGLEDVVMLSDFKAANFGKDYGLLMTNGIFDGLLSRCVIIIDKNGIITYTEQVPEIGQEPNYEAAINAL